MPKQERPMPTNYTTAQDRTIISLLRATGMFSYAISKLELYHGVVLAYDIDEDMRLREAVDNIQSPYPDENLMIAHEREGALTLIWKGKVPERFSEGNSVVTTYPNDPDDPSPEESLDYWLILHSVNSQVIDQQYIQKRLEELKVCLN